MAKPVPQIIGFGSLPKSESSSLLQKLLRYRWLILVTFIFCFVGIWRYWEQTRKIDDFEPILNPTEPIGYNQLLSNNINITEAGYGIKKSYINE